MPGRAKQQANLVLSAFLVRKDRLEDIYFEDYQTLTDEMGHEDSHMQETQDTEAKESSANASL